MENQIDNNINSNNSSNISSGTNSNNNSNIDPNLWVDQYGDSLYGYALSRIQDPSVAEDLIQETFLAALKSKENFQGRSSEKTWLTSILKHKIIDHIRKKVSRRSVENIGPSDEELDRFFEENGEWNAKPAKWLSDPSEYISQKEFWNVFTICLSELTGRSSDIFRFREMEEMSTDEICKVFDISATNLWVILHRTRALLRNCLENNWFEPGGG